MSDREILVPEVIGKSIDSMKLLTQSTGAIEIAIDFADGTSFSCTSCTKLELKAELYVGGVGEPQIIRRYGEV
jgi:hypothetical protein